MNGQEETCVAQDAAELARLGAELMARAIAAAIEARGVARIALSGGSTPSGAYQRLAARTERIVAAGLSMGGSLTLWTGQQHPEVAGLVCVNPATQPFADARSVPPACADCAHLAACGGGCAGRRRLMSALGEPDPYCPVVRGETRRAASR